MSLKACKDAGYTRSPFLPFKRLLQPPPASFKVLSRAQYNSNLLPVQHCCKETNPISLANTGRSSPLPALWPRPCGSAFGTYWLRLLVKELTGATVNPSLWLRRAAREGRSKLFCRQRPEGPSTPSFLIPAMTIPGGCRRPWPPAKGCRPWRSGAAAGAVGSSRAGPAGIPWQDLPSAAISCCGGESAHQPRNPRCATLRSCPRRSRRSPARNHPGRAGPSRAEPGQAAAATARSFQAFRCDRIRARGHCGSCSRGLQGTSGSCSPACCATCGSCSPAFSGGRSLGAGSPRPHGHARVPEEGWDSPSVVRDPA